jgi:hypothetical protein
MLGGTMFTGVAGMTTPLASEAAYPSPKALRAMTIAFRVLPMSPALGV